MGGAGKRLVAKMNDGVDLLLWKSISSIWFGYFLHFHVNL